MFKKIASCLFILYFFSENSFGQNLYLSVKGKDSIQTQVIDSLNYQRSFIDFSSLSTEIDSIHVQLQRIGYIESKLIETQKTNDSTYTSKFDLKSRFDTIYIYYANTGLISEDFEAFSETINENYFVIPINRTEAILNLLNQKIIDRGLPFAKLRLSNFNKYNDNNLRADLEISKNVKRKIDEIVIRGYEKFPKSFLKHFLRIRTGDDFNLSLIQKKSEELNNLIFANQTRSPEVLFTKDSTTLYFYIEKTKSNSFDGFLGFGTNEDTNKIEFDGYLNLVLNNSLNFGESIRLNYKSDENDQKTFRGQFNLPYLFGSALGTEFELNIFKKDSSFTIVNQSAELFYQLNSTQRIFAGINARQSNNLLDMPVQEIEDTDAIFYTLKYAWLKPQPNNYLFPIKHRLLARVGIGTRKVNSVTEQQQLFDFSSFKIFQLSQKNSIYLNITSGGLFGDTLFENELLRFGGINSIRGFEENSITASLFGVLNTEYRYQLNQSIYVHSIIDAAYLENDLSNAKDKLFGFGFGFGILTKAGLLKFNYANGKFEGQNFKLSNSKIHLSLNALF